MRLTKFSDYALRVLLLAASRPGRNVTIEEAAVLFDISAAHLKKVVRLLSHEGFLQATRGKSGGFQLAAAPEDINLGKVLRLTEPDFGMVECFLSNNRCALTRSCQLPGVINEALGAFIAVFDAYSLADMRVSPEAFRVSPPPARAARPCRGPLLPPAP